MDIPLFDADFKPIRVNLWVGLVNSDVKDPKSISGSDVFCKVKRELTYKSKVVDS